MTAFFVIPYLLWEIYRSLRQLRSPATKERYAAIEADLNEGRCAIEELVITSVFEIKEFEDEGAAFVLNTEDGRFLWLTGQDLYPYAADFEEEDEPFEPEDYVYGTFPSTRINYAYAPKSGFPLDVKGTGDYLAPSRLLSWPEDGPAFECFERFDVDCINPGSGEDFVKAVNLMDVPLAHKPA